MIITLKAEKDSYITNLKNNFFNASNANVGYAATLDLFKLYNENNNSFSWILLNFDDVCLDEDILTIIDAKGNIRNFEFDTNNALTNNENIRIDISNEIDQQNYSNIIKLLINADNDFMVDAYNNSNNELLLKQKISGVSGDTLITLPQNISASTTENVNDVIFGKFSRIDLSAISIKFDLQEFREKFLKNVNFAQSAFNNLEAKLILKDVTTGNTKPKNYNLQIFSLKKSFNEGLGRDTINFSDTGGINFVLLDEDNNWKIPEYISISDDVDYITNNGINQEIKVLKGDEDLIFDITDYIKQKINIEQDQDINDNGFIIQFSKENIFDNKSYFVKRLGSRHLIKKSFIPTLEIKIPDHNFFIPTQTFVKERFLNNEEIFYLYNVVSGKLTDFVLPNLDNDNTTPTLVKLKILSKDKSLTLVNNISSEVVTNFKGNNVLGIRKAVITNSDLSLYNDTITDLLIDGKLECYLSWYTEEDIDNVITTHTILEEKVVFQKSEKIIDKIYKNLKSTIKIENNNFYADDCITKCNVYFVDTRASHEPVRLPFDLPSEDLGTIQYQIINNENQKIIQDFEENTTAFFDGEKYVFNLCFPEIYKNFNIRFNFKLVDDVSDITKIIYNKTIFRIN